MVVLKVQVAAPVPQGKQTPLAPNDELDVVKT